MANRPVVLGYERVEMRGSLSVGEGLYIPQLENTVDAPKYPLEAAVGEYNGAIWNWDIDAAEWVQSTGGGDATPVTFVGKSYERANFESLDDFDVNTLLASVNSSVIVVPDAGVTDFSRALSRVGTSSLNRWKMEIEFRLTSAIDATSTGISIGMQSVNGDSLNSIALYFRMTTGFGGPGSMQFFYQTDPNPSWATSSSAASTLTFVPNNWIRLSIERIHDKVVMRAENLTNTAVAQVYYEVTMPYNGIPIPPNTGKYTIWGQGGTCEIRRITTWNYSPNRANIAFVGDSKTMGYAASSFLDTYPAIIGREYSNLAIMAGFGDTIALTLPRVNEILACNPRVIVINLGCNDIRFGDPYTTYADLVTALSATGTPIVHISPAYEGAQDLTAFYSWMKTAYESTGRFIDVFDTAKEAGMLHTDTIHWTEKMNEVVAKKIIDSNLLVGVNEDGAFIKINGLLAGRHTATGDGLISSFSWAHGLGFDPTGTAYTIDPQTSAAQGIYSKSANSTTFTVNYDTAPLGTLTYNWTAKKPE